MKKIMILLLSLFPLLIAWRLLSPLMPSGSYDLFVFYNHSQTANWYVYYTSLYLTLIINSYIIYELIRKLYPKLKVLALSILILSISRLAIYWMFRGSIAFDVLVGTALIYSLTTAWQKLR